MGAIKQMAIREGTYNFLDKEQDKKAVEKLIWKIAEKASIVNDPVGKPYR